MGSLRNYYFSRMFIGIVFGMLFIFFGAPWWAGLLAGLITLLGFAWAYHSGRYVKQIRADGQMKLVHDENTRAIANKAARNGFVMSVLALAFINLYFWKSGSDTLPIGYLQAILAISLLTFAISDIILRYYRIDWPGRDNQAKQ